MKIKLQKTQKTIEKKDGEIGEMKIKLQKTQETIENKDGEIGDQIAENTRND